MRGFLSALCLLSMSFAASAANHIVTVGGAGLIFTPTSLNITAGDTVTFTNAGGFHNVAADNGSFRCATDCTTSGGAASSSLWSFTTTYATVGTFGYHCEIHGSAGTGMAGTIVVQQTTPVTLQSFEVE